MLRILSRRRGILVKRNSRNVAREQCPPLAGVGGGCVNVAVMFSEVTGRQFFVHLRHCVTPPPAEDMGTFPGERACVVMSLRRFTNKAPISSEPLPALHSGARPV